MTRTSPSSAHGYPTRRRRWGTVPVAGHGSSSAGNNDDLAGRLAGHHLIERFNRTYREEVLDAYLFENLEQLRELSIEFIWSYNNERPHDARLGLTPREFLLKCGQLPAQYTGSRADFPTFQQDDHHKSTGVVIFRNSRA